VKKGLLMVSVALLLVSSLALGCPRPVPPQVVERLEVALAAEPPTLDLIRMACGIAATVIRTIAPGLVYRCPVAGAVVPVLAESWEFSPCGTMLTFYLRQGVRFHDGTPFNAEAVRFNLERFLQPGVPFRFMIDKVKAIEVVDDYTAKLRLTEPFAPIVAHLAHEFLGMFSPTAVKALKPGEFVTEPVGAGPFRFVEWIVGERIVLAAVEDHWGGRPYVDEIVFRTIPEAAVRVKMLEVGDVQVASIPAHEKARLEADPEITVLSEPATGRQRTVWINSMLPPFDDVRVRHALNYATDKEAIIQHLLHGMGTPGTAPLTPIIWGHHTVGPWPFNPDKARELLAEAGFPDGFKTRLLHVPMFDAPVIAEAMKAMWADVGIEVELAVKEWADFLAFIRRPLEEAIGANPRELALARGWGVPTADADYGLFPLYHSGQWPPVGWNIVFLNHPEVDRLLEKQRIEVDPVRRKALLAEVQKLIWAEAPVVFLDAMGLIFGTRHNVHGVYLNPAGEIPVFERARIGR